MYVHRLYRTAIVGIVDRLFPPQCAACNAIGSGLCALCVPRDAPAATRLLPGLSVRALGEYRGALRRAVLALKMAGATSPPNSARASRRWSCREPC